MDISLTREAILEAENTTLRREIAALQAALTARASALASPPPPPAASTPAPAPVPLAAEAFARGFSGHPAGDFAESGAGWADPGRE